jgi:molecular chaperone DnaK
MVNQAGKMLTEHADKISEDMKSAIKAASDELQGKLETDSADELKQLCEKLEQAMMKAGEAIYKATQEAAQQGAGNAGGAAPEGNGSENVVDADYSEVNK